VVLERIDSPADLRAVPTEDLPQLATELREAIVAAVARVGGHLGSNLGVVELTIALHRTFDSPRRPARSGTPDTRPTSTRCSPAGGTGSTPSARRAGCRATRAARSPRTTWSRTATPRPPCRGRSASPAGRPHRPARRAAPGRRGRRRRGADRRDGLRGAQQPRPPPAAGDHRPQRQRPFLRGDRQPALGAGRGPADRPALPQLARTARPGAHQAPARRAADGRRARGRQGGGVGGAGAAVVRRGARRALPRPLRRARRRPSRARARDRRPAADPGARARAHPEGQGVHPGRDRPREEAARHLGVRHRDGARPTGPKPRSWTQAFSEVLLELADEHPELVAITAAMPGSTGMLPLASAHPTGCSTSASPSSTP
jgi:1-deoxy-D-xylulose-5-phosphate synthase